MPIKVLAALILMIAMFMFTGWAIGSTRSQGVSIALFFYVMAALFITFGFVLKYYFGD